MARKGVKRKAALPGVWPESATVADVISFASARVPEFLLLFADAMRRRDREHAVEDIRLLRGVVSKLDQFRRMKVREWNKPIAQPKEREEINA